MKSLFLSFGIGIFLLSCQEGSNESTTPMPKPSGETIAFYNVENLFDTIDSKGISDGDFLPHGKKYWTQSRYLKKLKDLAQVFNDLGPKGPAIIGLSEIENKAVILQLIETAGYSEDDYEIVHYNSADNRGIDVALVFKKKYFRFISSESIRLVFPFDPDVLSRDILKVKLQGHQDELTIFVNHWPSRRDGTKETEPKRLFAAETLRGLVDEELKKDPNADLVIMGDFNDAPEDQSLNAVLGASITKNEEDLINLSARVKYKFPGTLVHDREWLMFDQIIVSRNFKKKLTGKLEVFAPDYLLYQHSDGRKSPNKTYGSRYYGGYSDHLPVRIIFR